MKKTLHIISLFTFALTMTFILIIFTMLVYPYKVIEFYNENNIAVDKSVYHAGEKMYLTIDYHKHMNIEPKTKKELVCKDSLSVLTPGRRLPVGRDITKMEHTIPLNVPTDEECHIYIFLSYKVNPIRTVEMTLKTEQFSVINEKL